MALKGIDISNWQSINAVDEAPDFVIIKATQGVEYVSPTCDAQYQRVKKVGKLERDIETSKRDKGARVHMLCKDFNIKQNTAEAWLSLEDYAYSTGKLDMEDFRDCYALAAVDLSETTDLTSVKILVMRPGDKTKYVFSHYWIPESKLIQSDDRESGAVNARNRL